MSKSKPVDRDVFRWEEPPKPQNGRNIWRRSIADTLRKNPGRKARVEENCKSTSAMSNWVAYGCKATSRKQPDGTYVIWAWWPTPEEQDKNNG